MSRATSDARSRRPGALQGREADLDRLTSLLTTDTCRMVLVTGEAGMGKTTLVEHALARLPDVAVARGACVPFGGATLPFAPVVGLLEDLLARFGDERLLAWAGGGARALGSLMPGLVEPGEPSDMQRTQLFDAVARIVRGAAQGEGLVVVVEDLHWADESSLAMLQFLVRTVGQAPVAIVGTVRTEEVGRGHPLRPLLADLARLVGTERIDLVGLGRDEVAAMLTALHGRPPGVDELDRVHRRSEGVPFYVEELAALDDGDRVPDSLRDALDARTRGLSPSARQTLGRIAVAGRVDHELLALASGRDPDALDGDLAEVVDTGVVVVDGRDFAFRHALLRDAVYDDLLPGPRARLHAGFAAALEHRPDLGHPPVQHAIALHWSAAGDDARAFAAALAAARSDSVAHAETLRMYETILDLWDAVPDAEALAGPREALLTAAATSAHDAGELGRAIDLVSAALDATPPSDQAGRIQRLLLRGQFRTDALRDGAAEDTTEAAAMLEHVTDPRVLAHALAEIARYELNHSIDARSTARRAVAAAVAAGDARSEAGARATLGSALVFHAEEEAGLAELLHARTVEGADLASRLRSHINRSDALHLAGRFAEARDDALEGLAIAREHGVERAFGTYLAGNAAKSLLALGRWDDAERLLADALALDPPASHSAHLTLVAAWLALWRGDVGSDATLRDRRALIEDPSTPAQYAIHAIRIDAEHAALTGDAELAWADFLRYADDPGRYDPGRAYPVIAVGAAAATALDRRDQGGRRERVRRLADDPLVAVRGAWAAVVAAELSDDAAGWRSGIEALETHGAAAPAHLLPYARLRLAQHLAEHVSGSADRAALRDVIATATAEATALGSGLLVSRLSTLARRTGLPTERAAVGHGLDALTSRELEVLRLVALGRSNREIAVELFISVKTASVHVSNILAKLGVAGRGEAGSIAHRSGLVTD